MAGSVVDWNSLHPQIRRFSHGYTSDLFCVRHHRINFKLDAGYRRLGANSCDNLRVGNEEVGARRGSTSLTALPSALLRDGEQGRTVSLSKGRLAPTGRAIIGRCTLQLKKCSRHGGGWRISRDAFCRDVCAHSAKAHTCRQQTPARMRHPREIEPNAKAQLLCRAPPPRS